MAQTWHQLRPGEVRNDCGGCHAHSQKPTAFENTAAAKPDYAVFDLTQQTPLLTTKKNDQSGKKWDAKDETGLRFEKGVKNVEYFRDVKPILERSCVACHTGKPTKPAGNLVLDDDTHAATDGPGQLHHPASEPKDRNAEPLRLAVPVAQQPADVEAVRPARRTASPRRWCPARRQIHKGYLDRGGIAVEPASRGASCRRRRRSKAGQGRGR